MRNQIREFLQAHTQQLNDFQFSDDESLLDAGIIDSMSMVALIAFLENEFTMHVEEEDMTPEHFDSVNSIVDFIRQKKNA